ncbi:MAG: hypothetical protein Q9175_000338 [Cornicularia normoerica]
MHSSFIAIFVAVLAPKAVLASPQWHPHAPPGPINRWHHGPSSLEPSATASIAAGILPTGVSGAGSTGIPKMADERKKISAGILPTGVSSAGSTATPKKPDVKKKEEGVSGVASAGSTGTLAPAASASQDRTLLDAA